MNADSTTVSSQAKIWNPNAVANWSLLFTPIFGSWLTYLNWKALGEEGKAAASKYWLIGSIIFIVVAGVAINVVDNPKYGMGTIGAYFVLLLMWFWIENRTQNSYVKDKLSGGYQKQGWIKPLSIALAALVVWQLALSGMNRRSKASQQENTQVSAQTNVQVFPQEIVPASLQENEPASSIKIKGLSIGMNIGDAPSAMKGILANQHLVQYGITGIRKVGENNCLLMLGNVQDLLRKIDEKGSYRFNSNGGYHVKVPEEEKKKYREKSMNDILNYECSDRQGSPYTNPEIVSFVQADVAIAVWAGADGKVNKIYFNNFDDIFNAKGLPVAEFMQKFMDAYSIPEMKPSNDGWTYVSTDGSMVEARVNNGSLAWIHLTKVASANDIKQGFN